jgi:hypothetical protein
VAAGFVTHFLSGCREWQPSGSLPSKVSFGFTRTSPVLVNLARIHAFRQRDATYIRRARPGARGSSPSLFAFVVGVGVASSVHTRGALCTDQWPLLPRGRGPWGVWRRGFEYYNTIFVYAQHTRIDSFMLGLGRSS